MLNLEKGGGGEGESVKGVVEGRRGGWGRVWSVRGLVYTRARHNADYALQYIYNIYVLNV